jgi:hypothetical protein
MARLSEIHRQHRAFVQLRQHFIVWENYTSYTSTQKIYIVVDN